MKRGEFDRCNGGKGSLKEGVNDVATMEVNESRIMQEGTKEFAKGDGEGGDGKEVDSGKYNIFGKGRKITKEVEFDKGEGGEGIVIEGVIDGKEVDSGKDTIVGKGSGIMMEVEFYKGEGVIDGNEGDSRNVIDEGEKEVIIHKGEDEDLALMNGKAKEIENDE